MVVVEVVVVVVAVAVYTATCLGGASRVKWGLLSRYPLPLLRSSRCPASSSWLKPSVEREARGGEPRRGRRPSAGLDTWTIRLVCDLSLFSEDLVQRVGCGVAAMHWLALRLCRCAGRRDLGASGTLCGRSRSGARFIPGGRTLNIYFGCREPYYSAAVRVGRCADDVGQVLALFWVAHP